MLTGIPVYIYSDVFDVSENDEIIKKTYRMRICNRERRWLKRWRSELTYTCLFVVLFFVLPDIRPKIKTGDYDGQNRQNPVNITLTSV